MPEIYFNTDRFFEFTDHFVAQAVKKTIVILDNSPVHKSRKFKSKIEEWKDNDVFIFFLSPYSQELNLIEILE